MDDENRKKAEALVAQMTIEEQASQLRYDAPKIDRLGIPAYNWWNEALHGVARAGTATSFPQAIGMAAMFDEQLLEEIADAIATEGRAKYNACSEHGDRDIYKGLTFWTPNINIFRDPRWGRGHETYGEDPYLTGELGKAFIKGLQGDGKVMKAAACAKHFAVHSGPEALRHKFDAVVSDKDLWETYLPAFETCVKDAKVESVMGAYNRTNGEPCCGSTTLLRKILREKWGFSGHVVSDCWAIRDFHTQHEVTVTPAESAALALKAGCDLNCGNTYLHILNAYKQGLVTKEDITKAAVRLYTTRFKLGLFEGSEYDQIPYEKVECSKHLELAEKAARESLVLLKNDGILPLNKDKLNKIGVIGPNANSRLALKANYYGTASRYITILEGIQDEVKEQVRVLYAKGCDLREDRTESLAMEHDRLAEALTVAEHSEIVILCLGLDETIEGEEKDEGNHVGSGDKEDLELPKVQRELLEQVVAVGKPTILLLLAGSAINISYAKEHCSGILLAWYPGARGGKSVADILFGKVSPSGKLPITFYRNTKDLPDFEDYSMRNRTYRYYTGMPLYSFGYGLTYGKGICLKGQIEWNGERQKAKLSLEVGNQSDYETDEVLQIYIKNTTSEFAVTNYELKKFKRIHLATQVIKKLELEIGIESFYVTNEQGEKVLDGMDYIIYAGFSQPDAVSIEELSSAPLVLSLHIK